MGTVSSNYLIVEDDYDFKRGVMSSTYSKCGRESSRISLRWPEYAWMTIPEKGITESLYILERGDQMFL